MTNGQPLRVRAAMKPISTVPRALATVDMATGDEAVAIHQRSDVCAVPAAGVVVETMVALVLARAALEKFGGDSLTETRAQHRRRTCAPSPSAMPTDAAQAGCRGSAMAPKAVLVGLPGSGKSTIGRRLAKALGVPLLDTDAAIEADDRPHHRRHLRHRRRAGVPPHRGRGRPRRAGRPRRRAVARRRRDHQPRCARRAGRAHRDLPGDQRRRGRAPHRRQHRAPAAGRPRPRREVPRADDRAGSAVPAGRDASGSTPTAAIPGPWCATSCRGWRTRRQQPRARPRRRRRPSWRPHAGRR